MSNQNNTIVCRQRAESIKDSIVGSNNGSQQGQMWCVRGQAKMGKSTLLQHFLIGYL